MSHDRTELVAPSNRFEWERIVRRCKLNSRDVAHLLPSEAASRPVAGTLVKAVALCLATYGNRDGTAVYPGAAKLARVLCSTPRSVGQALAVLRQVGLIERVRLGSRTSAQADEYRLTLPADLLEVVAMLTPDELDHAGNPQDDSSDGQATTRPVVTPEHETGRRVAPDDPAQAPDDSAETTGRLDLPPSQDHPSTKSEPVIGLVAASTTEAHPVDERRAGAELCRRELREAANR